LPVGEYRVTRDEFSSDSRCCVSDGVKAAKSAKLEQMKKKERKKLRKMKSEKFEMAAKAKALWEDCRRYVR